MSTGMPAGIWLQKFGVIVADYFGHTAYHVGSSLRSKEWRDVDVRLILPDDEFAARFGEHATYADARLAAVTLAFSALGQQMTGLPIDFQIQSASHANGRYGSEWRSALTEVEPAALAGSAGGSLIEGVRVRVHADGTCAVRMSDGEPPDDENWKVIREQGQPCRNVYLWLTEEDVREAGWRELLVLDPCPECGGGPKKDGHTYWCDLRE